MSANFRLSDPEESEEAEASKERVETRALVNPIAVVRSTTFLVPLLSLAEPTTTGEIEIGPKNPQTV